MLALTLGILTLGHGAAAAAQNEPAELPRAGFVTPKLLRYAERIVRKYDLNGDGRLAADEWSAMRGTPASIDANADGAITVEEFAEHAARHAAGRAIRLAAPGSDTVAASGTLGEASPPASDTAPADSKAPLDPRRNLKFFTALPAGVPAWFAERDRDGDGQLTLSEFSPKLLKSEIDEFQRHDLNRDGVLTTREYLRAGKAATAEQGRAGQ